MYCVFNTLNFYEIFKILRCVKKKKRSEERRVGKERSG